MHVRESLEDLAPLVLGPHHERVHRPFNVGLIAVPSSSFPEDSRFCRSSASCWPTIIGLGFICRTIYLRGPCGAKSRNRKRERGKTRIKCWARVQTLVPLLLSSLGTVAHVWGSLSLPPSIHPSSSVPEHVPGVTGWDRWTCHPSLLHNFSVWSIKCACFGTVGENWRPC